MSYNELPPSNDFEYPPILPYMPTGDFTFNAMQYPNLMAQGTIDFSHMQLPDYTLPLPMALPPPPGQWSPNRDHMVAGPEGQNFSEFEGIAWQGQEMFYNQDEAGCADENRSTLSYSDSSPYSRGDREDKYRDGQLTDDEGQEIDLKLPEGINRDELTHLGIPELNKKLKDIGVNKLSEKELKRLRRQFKNRGYAQVCREKKNKKKNTMRQQKESLEREIKLLQQDVENLRKERNRYKEQYDKIHRNKSSFLQKTQ